MLFCVPRYIIFLSVSEMRIALKYMCGSRGYYNFQEVKIPKTTRRTFTFHGANLVIYFHDGLAPGSC